MVCDWFNHVQGNKTCIDTTSVAQTLLAFWLGEHTVNIAVHSDTELDISLILSVNWRQMT